MSLPWRTEQAAAMHVRHVVTPTILKRKHQEEEEDSLGHLSDVFVSQAHPQVIVLMQQHLLLTRVSHAAGIVPEGDKRLEVITFDAPE